MRPVLPVGAVRAVLGSERRSVRDAAAARQPFPAVAGGWVHTMAFAVRRDVYLRGMAG